MSENKHALDFCNDIILSKTYEQSHKNLLSSSSASEFGTKLHIYEESVELTCDLSDQSTSHTCKGPIYNFKGFRVCKLCHQKTKIQTNRKLNQVQLYDSESLTSIITRFIRPNGSRIIVASIKEETRNKFGLEQFFTCRKQQLNDIDHDIIKLQRVSHGGIDDEKISAFKDLLNDIIEHLEDPAGEFDTLINNLNQRLSAELNSELTSERLHELFRLEEEVKADFDSYEFDFMME
jgi:hypothetical protein